VRKLFSLPAAIEARASAKYAVLLQESSPDESIIVHVRRGDYLTHIGGALNHLTSDYYASAIERAKAALRGAREAKVLVFSDDLGWCAKQPWLRGARMVDEPDEVLALWIMSRYKHYVMSNSSFCWWSVFLGAPYGHVFAPDPWFGPRHWQDFEDIYCDDWVRHKFSVGKDLVK
jgi:hypothetical protein